MIVGDITIKINSSNINHFKNIGYNVDLNDIIVPDMHEINKGSHASIKIICDKCNSEKIMEFRVYYKLTKELTDIYLCKKCSYEKNKKTNLLKYGYEHPMKNQNIVNKLINTNNIKYNRNSASMLDEIKKKIKNTNLLKYNCISPLQNKKIKEKTKQTNLLKYNFDHHNKNEKIKEKIKNTKKLKYNDKYYNNHNKYKTTCLLKYGVDNVSKNDIIKNKINETKSKNLMIKYSNILSVDYINKKLIMMCDNNKNHKFEIDISVFQNRKQLNTIICTKCNHGTKSGLEISFFNFIKKNYSENILQNIRNIIKPYELDIYLPDLNIAFEFNGLYWHNELNKPNDYHKIKSDLCLEKGIQLIHVWEDDWMYKQDIIKSMILNKLGKNINKIYARKTIIKEITDNKLVKEFLNNNHLQGYISSTIKIGLFYNDNLISFMSFGKLRTPMNSNSKEREYEMLRFCNKLNTIVIGGASKLFNYFIKTYNPLRIISYADRSYSNGKLYEQLGFIFSHITIPNYYYIINNIKIYRYNFRKDILTKQGYDINKSEHQIMLERKIYRIYNSGNYKYIYLI
jgi:hypothetical protein